MEQPTIKLLAQSELCLGTHCQNRLLPHFVRGSLARPDDIAFNFAGDLILGEPGF